jgi:hypothetical protein
MCTALNKLYKRRIVFFALKFYTQVWSNDFLLQIFNIIIKVLRYSHGGIFLKKPQHSEKYMHNRVSDTICI